LSNLNNGRFDSFDEPMIGPSATFLNPDEVALLTGFRRKGRQVEQLRRMGIAFYINGCGRPVVARTSIEERTERAPPSGWTPSVVKLARGA
jgi:hypothetical protein